MRQWSHFHGIDTYYLRILMVERSWISIGVVQFMDLRVLRVLYVSDDFQEARTGLAVT